MAQLVKNLPAMWETWFQSLDWEDSLEKGTVTHAGILDWRIPWTWGRKELDAKSWTHLSDFRFNTLKEDKSIPFASTIRQKVT